MKTNGEESAFPQEEYTVSDYSDTMVVGGLSKREYFAAKAMQGMLANPDDHSSYANTIAKAVECADMLIAALNKEGGANG